jgi:acyl-CoA reductase-like NAD-dependent aldehyde dehydrogenase
VTATIRSPASPPSQDRLRLESRDPATGRLLGSVPITPPEAISQVAAEVAVEQAKWALRPLEERAHIVAEAAQIMLRRAEELAVAVTHETGKPLMEATFIDVGAGAMVLDWMGRHGPRYLRPERLPTPQLILKHKRQTIVYRPLGVVGIITAWNYPLLIPAGPLGAALVAGNGVVMKPSEHTPLAGDLIAAIFEEAGLPRGVLRMVHGDGSTGAALCSSPAIAKVWFTGGVANGLDVMRLAAEHGKAVVLELGGKDPAIVCHDADLDRAVAGTLWAGTAGTGQTCAAIERVYVDRRVYEEYVRRLVLATRDVRPGDPLDPGTQIGSFIHDGQYERVQRHIDEAVAGGAHMECGGPVDVDGLSGRFMSPVVLTGVNHSMAVMREETFGPVIPVMPFDTEAEAVRLANDSTYGLGASVWSRDPSHARRIARQLTAGMIWVNDHGSSAGAAQAPWAGIRQSGRGIVHSKFGLYEMVEKRLVSEDRGWLPVPWWYPYDDVGRRGLTALLQTVYAPGLRAKARTGWHHRAAFVGLGRKLLRARKARGG